MSTEGVEGGPASLQSRIRTTACATLNAAQKLLSDKCVLSLEDITYLKW